VADVVPWLCINSAFTLKYVARAPKPASTYACTRASSEGGVGNYGFVGLRFG